MTHLSVIILRSNPGDSAGLYFVVILYLYFHDLLDFQGERALTDSNHITRVDKVQESHGAIEFPSFIKIVFLNPFDVDSFLVKSFFDTSIRLLARSA